MNDYLIRFALLRERAFREPNNRELFRQLLFCMELTGNYPESRELYEEILERHPYSSYAWYNLGWACMPLDAPDDALEAFEYAYITMPALEEAYHAYAELAIERGLYRAALRCYAEMHGHVDTDSETLARMAECHLRLGETGIAKKICSQILQSDPHCAGAYYQLGACFAAEKDYRPAAKWMRTAIRMDECRETFHSALALTYQQLGQTKKALSHFWRAVEIAPEESASWLQLADFLIFKGEMTQAREVIEQALENTSGAELLYCSAACQLLTGDRDSGVLTLRQALAADAGRQSSIYRWAPDLRDDAEITGLLNNYK